MASIALANAANIATIESSSAASKSYTAGEYLAYNGTLYQVINAISKGATLTVGTNIKATNVGAELKSLNETAESKEPKLSSSDIPYTEQSNDNYSLNYINCCIKTGKILIVSGEIRCLNRTNEWNTVAKISGLSLACEAVECDAGDLDSVTTGGAALRIRLHNDESDGILLQAAMGRVRGGTTGFRFTLTGPLV